MEKEGKILSIKNTLGKRIAKLRKIKQISQEALAEKCEINVNSLSYIENGRNFPSPETLDKIMNALNIEPKDIFNFNRPKSKDDLLKAIQNKIEIIKDDKNILEQLYFYLDSIV